MAKETLVRLIDDLDGSEAVESLTFALRGNGYAIDLNAKNVAALEKSLGKYISKARPAESVRVTMNPAPARVKPARGGRRRDTRAPSGDVGVIRQWARSNGLKVSDRGRVSASVKDAYDAAHGE